MVIGFSSAVPLELVTAPVTTAPTTPAVNNDQKMFPINEARQNGEMILNRYSQLIDSDKDHLVHGIFQLLMKTPISFANIPQEALSIALKAVEQKLGRNDVDILTKPFLMAIDEHYQTKSKEETTTMKLTEETKLRIEEILDKVMDEETFNSLQ